MVWTPALELLQKSIDKQGFFHCPYSFKKFALEQGIVARMKTPKYVSINFGSEQHSEFKKRGWNVTRLSRGSFGVFSEKYFPSPYASLSINSAEKLDLEGSISQPHIIDAFKLMMDKSSAENTFIEMLRFGGVYDLLIERFSSSRRFTVGPRGNFRQQFNLHMRKKDQELLTFKYNGQTELDYSLWSEDRIFIIEAKSLPKNGLDIGWHKLAFPAQYFSGLARKHGVEIIPVYLLRNFSSVDNTVYVFVFPPYESYNENGLILNDQEAMNPEHVLKVDLNELIPNSQQKIRSFA